VCAVGQKLPATGASAKKAVQPKAAGKTKPKNTVQQPHSRSPTAILAPEAPPAAKKRKSVEKAAPEKHVSHPTN